MEMKVPLVLLFVSARGFCYKEASENGFPNDFLFGVATSAYQIEGAWNVSGKSVSNWDHYTHTRAGNIADRGNGDIACNSYNKVAEDVKLLKDLGVDFYRFSISWTRILPSPLKDIINADGIRYYNTLINLLLDNKIEPVITIFHWDLPQQLQEFGGFTNPLIVEPFVEFAKVVFENFGDRVKQWITINEPHIMCLFGYGRDASVPGYNISGIAEYLCGHYVLKAHAAVYHLYNNTYKSKQKGKISISLDSRWYEPASDLPKDIEAAETALQFELGIYAHPIFSEKGDYPEVVKRHIAKRSDAERFSKSRLPQLTNNEIEEIRGTYDYFCLNHYSSLMAASKPPESIGEPSFDKDMGVHYYTDETWPPTASKNNFVVPWGLTKLLAWIKKEYRNPIIYITENGYADKGEIDDIDRKNFYKLYLEACLDAINSHGVQVKAYTAWCLMDNFEWKSGYKPKFGLHHVDFSDPDRPRKQKTSAIYYKSVISSRRP